MFAAYVVKRIWTGILWIAYEFTNDEKYRNLAVKHITTFYKRIDEKLGVNHHDMGFCICRHASLHINFWAITLQKKQLSRRQIICFPDKEKRGSLFKCGDINDPSAYRLIIDCLMNIPLLYWATKVTGKKYDEAGYNHFNTTVNAIFAAD